VARSRSVVSRKSAATWSSGFGAKKARKTWLPHFSQVSSAGRSSSNVYSLPHSRQTWTSTPPYNKPTRDGLLAHYRAVLEAADLPLIVYNIPGRAAVNLPPGLIAELVRDERVIGVKEASGDISQIAELARLTGDRLALWSGNDDQIVPLLALGGVGVISVLANVAPGDVSRMVHRFLDGDVPGARELQLRYLPLIGALFAESNPIPVKAAVGMLGFAVGEPRLPLTSAAPATRERLRAALREAGLEPSG
jgi:4-hydroxy-tetrahydrodipicolinate synthase